MIAGTALPLSLRAAAQMISYLCFLLQVVQIAELIREKAHRWKIIACGAVLFINVTLLQRLLRSAHERRFIPVTAVLPLGMLLLVGVFLVAGHIWIRKQRQRVITERTIKEAVDQLPAGLCFSYENGLCRLVNVRMNEVAGELTGEGLRDASLFWSRIEKNDLVFGKSERAEEGFFVHSEGGNVYYVKRKPVECSFGLLYGITLTDVSEEDALRKELEETCKKTREINLRLQQLNEQILETTRQREILDSKVRLHDDWSRALLLAKRYAEKQLPAQKGGEGTGASCVKPDSDVRPFDAEEVLRLWEKNLTLLETEHRMTDPEEDDIFRSEEPVLGISIERAGVFPQSAKGRSLLNLAATTCISNIVSHTNGHTLRVTGEMETDGYIIRFTNDGEPPEREIRETGGLGNLRRKVEEADGQMRIQSSPAFCLTIRLKDAVKEDSI